MENQREHDSIKQKVDQIKQMENQIMLKRKEIGEIERKIKKESLKLWDSCQHTWVYDKTDYDSTISHYCSKCKLYNQRFLYLNPFL